MSELRGAGNNYVDFSEGLVEDIVSRVSMFSCFIQGYSFLVAVTHISILLVTAATVGKGYS